LLFRRQKALDIWPHMGHGTSNLIGISGEGRLQREGRVSLEKKKKGKREIKN